MNQIATRAPAAPDLPLAIVAPEISTEMFLLFRHLEQDPTALRKPDVVKPHHVAEAASLVLHYRAVCDRKAADADSQVMAWLRQLNRGMAFMLNPQDLTGVHSQVVRSSGDLPAAVFNEETLASAGRALERLSAFRVDTHLRPIARVITVQKAHLEAILARRETQAALSDGSSGHVLSIEARNAVLAKFRKDRSAVPAWTPAPVEQVTSARPRASVLSDADLLAQAEQLAVLPGPMQQSYIIRRDRLRARLAGQQ